MNAGLAVTKLTAVLLGGLGMLALAAAPPAQAEDGWQQPTEASFWANAASAATATIYAPTTTTLHQAKVGQMDFASSSLAMFRADQWSVTAVYGISTGRSLTVAQGTDNGSADHQRTILDRIHPDSPYDVAACYTAGALAADAIAQCLTNCAHFHCGQRITLPWHSQAQCTCTARIAIVGVTAAC